MQSKWLGAGVLRVNAFATITHTSPLEVGLYSHMRPLLFMVQTSTSCELRKRQGNFSKTVVAPHEAPSIDDKSHSRSTNLYAIAAVLDTIRRSFLS
jgi:hypothetical protein